MGKHVLNLPKTSFGMKPKASSFEAAERKWEEEDVYNSSLRGSTKEFVLHDGPPYANGDVHIGHALNKVMKDIILKRKRMQGFAARFIPGWDTHGLPIELKATEGVDKTDSGEMTHACQTYAWKWVNVQRESFKDLGIHADWDNPYITMDEEYKCRQLEVFNDMYQNGLVYKGSKAVYWSPSSETALAEAEVEHKEVTSKSVYVRFKTNDDRYLVVWTTTPWTLPANQAVAFGEEVKYSEYYAPDDNTYVVADNLSYEFFKATGLTQVGRGVALDNEDFSDVQYEHPFSGKLCPIVSGFHVTDSMGTGLVHIAPGHGEDDFKIGLEHGLEPVCILDERGHYNELAGVYVGDFYLKANKRVMADLEDIMSVGTFAHPYPHDWRTKKPIVFRVTSQWFVKVGGELEQKAVEAVKDVNFYPDFGQAKMLSMLEDRPDWCISRQRFWGVPIPIFYQDGEPLYNQEIFEQLMSVFEEQGTSAWKTDSPRQLLGSLADKYNADNLTKETDIMDVWFDSGASHRAVGKPKADLYLEGSDQYRGWFQTSLLTAMAAGDPVPYKNVVTHGFVLDGKGRKMSKSLGNVISPRDVINKYNKDVLRLWTVSVDYQSDVRISNEILEQVNEDYRRLRNSFRFLLGNLYDFDPVTDPLALEDLHEVDRYMLHELEELKTQFDAHYDRYDFFGAHRLLMSFVREKLSAFYFDITKDRLYVERPDSAARRSIQTVFWYYLNDLVAMLAPVTSYLAEEVWDEMLFETSVFEHSWYDARPEWLNPELKQRWDMLLSMRNKVNKRLEEARSSGLINKSVEAELTISFPDTLLGNEIVKNMGSVPTEYLEEIFIVSSVKIDASSEIGELDFVISKHPGEKCEKCWKYSEEISDGICPRCQKTV